MSEVTSYYDKFAEKQLKAGINHRHLSIQRYMERFGLKKHHHVLEIGCGIGTQTELLLRYLHSTGQVAAYDLSPVSISYAQRRLEKYNNVELKAADIVSEKIDKKFDFILLPDVLEHIPIEAHKDLFSKLDACLKDDGLLVIHIPHPDYIKWIEKNAPDQLQIIDQALYTHLILENLRQTNLKLDYLESYSIYMKPADYQLLVFKKHDTTQYVPVEKLVNDSFTRRMSKKMQYLLRGKK